MHGILTHLLPFDDLPANAERRGRSPIVQAPASLLRKEAVLSPCGQYRYRLSRVWDDSKPLAVWIMLNPSTADAILEDATIKKCMAFGRSWDCGGIEVVNLFAFRATSPDTLMREKEPMGSENPRHVCQTLIRAAKGKHHVIAAWGANVTGWEAGEGMVASLRRWAKEFLPCGLKALVINQDGTPRHPLYVPGSAMPQDYPL